MTLEELAACEAGQVWGWNRWTYWWEEKSSRWENSALRQCHDHHLALFGISLYISVTSNLMLDYLVCAGPKVLLPGNDDPTPASIIVDKSSGKILEVRQGQHTTQDLGLVECSVEWIDAGNNIVLPGLVEFVSIFPCPPVLVSKNI